MSGALYAAKMARIARKERERKKKTKSDPPNRPYCGYKASVVLFIDEDGATNEIDGAGYCLYCEYLFTVKRLS